MQVIFRVDSAYNIGTGHVMRCLSLADGLSESPNHPKPIFICKNHKGNLGQRIQKRGYQTYLIPNTYEPTLNVSTWLGGPWQEDVEATIEVIQNQDHFRSQALATWLIIDHYDIHLDWEETIKKVYPNLKLMSIDDYLDRKHNVNILLNQMYFKNLTQIEKSYQELMVNPNTKLLIGTYYCLLNPIIQKYRKAKSVAQPSTFKILISLGGCDPENVTLKVLQNLTPVPISTQIEYHVVIGTSNQHADSLRAEIAQNPNKIHLHQGLSQEEMFQLISTISLAIGSIGVSMYERLCIGVPTIIITIAENQQAIAQELSEANLVDDLGFGLNFDITKMRQIINQKISEVLPGLQSELETEVKGKPLIEKEQEYQKTCDGRGISRIIKVMESYIDQDMLESTINQTQQKTGCIIQARMTSTRLPGKVLIPVYEDRSMLEMVLQRLQESRYLDEIIVATTTNRTDDPIIDLCEKKLGHLNKIRIRTFRGSEHNVLERYYLAAKQYNLTTVVRVTSDCPLIDPNVLDKIIKFQKQNPQYNYVSNTLERTYPRGLDSEVFTFNALQKVYQTATKPAEFEHVTTKIIGGPSKSNDFFRYAYRQSGSKNDSHYRLTVDTPEDLVLIKKIYKGLENPLSTLSEIKEYLASKPELLKINQAIEQKPI